MEQNDKIAIIGTGPAGLYLAYLLQKKGFKNVEIFEEKEEVGGRVQSYKTDETIHELGACWTAPNYEAVHETMEEFEMEMPHMAGATGRRCVVYGQKYKKSSPFSTFFAAIRYSFLYRSFFGKYFKNGVLHWDKVPEKIQKLWILPFNDFLLAKNLTALRPPFSLMLAGQGYGFIGSIPTFYALYWLTPLLVLGYRFQLFDSFLSLLPGQLESNISKITGKIFKKVHPFFSATPLIVPEGFQTLFKKMEEAVLKTYPIYKKTRIEKIEKKFHEIELSFQGKKRSYDFVLSSISWPDLKNVLENPSHWEEEMMKKTKTYTLISGCIKGKITPQTFKNSVVTFADALERQGELYTIRHSKSALERTNLPPPSDKKEEFVTYQILDRPIGENEIEGLKIKLIEGLEKRAYLKEIELLSYNVYTKYNQHLKGEDLFLLKSLAEESKRERLIHIGAGVSFDSVLNIFNYNKELLTGLCSKEPKRV